MERKISIAPVTAERLDSETPHRLKAAMFKKLVREYDKSCGRDYDTIAFDISDYKDEMLFAELFKNGDVMMRVFCFASGKGKYSEYGNLEIVFSEKKPSENGEQRIRADLDRLFDGLVRCGILRERDGFAEPYRLVFLGVV